MNTWTVTMGKPALLQVVLLQPGAARPAHSQASVALPAAPVLSPHDAPELLLEDIRAFYRELR